MRASLTRCASPASDTSLVLIACIGFLTGCVSIPRFESMRHRAETSEAETQKALMYLAGSHADNAMLQQGLIDQEAQIKAFVGGLQLQAKITADMRKSCDL